MIPKQKLSEEWKSAWKWLSVQCMAGAASVQAAWAATPDDLKALVPHGLALYITLGLLGLGIVGRVLKPAEKPDESTSANGA
jgi:hypothetical protein